MMRIGETAGDYGPARDIRKPSSTAPEEKRGAGNDETAPPRRAAVQLAAAVAAAFGDGCIGRGRIVPARARLRPDRVLATRPTGSVSRDRLPRLPLRATDGRAPDAAPAPPLGDRRRPVVGPATRRAVVHRAALVLGARAVPTSLARCRVRQHKYLPR